MSTELMKVYPGRPAILKKGPVTMYLSVHDQAFFEARKTWKARLRDAHPDRGGKQRIFQKLFKDYSAWRQQELKFYSSWGVEPPLPIKLEIHPETEILELPQAPLCWCGKPASPKFRLGSTTTWNKGCCHPHGVWAAKALKMRITPQQYVQRFLTPA